MRLRMGSITLPVASELALVGRIHEVLLLKLCAVISPCRINQSVTMQASVQSENHLRFTAKGNNHALIPLSFSYD